MEEGGHQKGETISQRLRVQDGQTYLLSTLKAAPGMVNGNGQHLHTAEILSKQHVNAFLNLV